MEFMKFVRQQKFRLVVFVASGTSDNAAQLVCYLTEITTGIPASLAAPSVHTLYRTKLDYRQALVIGISQSGEGTDINMVLESASLRVRLRTKPATIPRPPTPVRLCGNPRGGHGESD